MNAYDSPEDNTISALKDRIAELEAWQKHDLELAEATGFERAHKLQADRIAELEHMNKNWQLSETMAYNRISELERKAKAFEQSCRVATTQIKALQAELETNAEPVAWWNGKEPSVLGLSYFKNDYCEIPLYTTPQTKPLSKADLDNIHAKLVRVLENWNVSNFVNADDGEPFGLIDLLSGEGNTIESGKHEIQCMADELTWEIKEIIGNTTPQTKPLSDEEIELECRKAWNLHNQDSLYLEQVIKFARAIEERHGIK